MFTLRRGERERRETGAGSDGAQPPGEQGRRGSSFSGAVSPSGKAAEGSAGRRAPLAAGRAAMADLAPGGKRPRPGQADPDGNSPVRARGGRERTPPLLPGLPRGRPGRAPFARPRPERFSPPGALRLPPPAARPAGRDALGKHLQAKQTLPHTCYSVSSPCAFPYVPAVMPC